MHSTYGSPRFLAMTVAVFLGALPVSAHAQYVPPWLVAAVLSPILVFILCIILGVLTRSIRIGGLHAVLVLTWIVLFSLASYFVENDYVIWTPLALYTLHSTLLLVLIVVETGRRIAGRTDADKG
jgi:hypothetical protein